MDSVKTTVASAPFDSDTGFADIILRTSDKFDFFVHVPILRLASTVFDAMLSIPQPPSATNDTQTSPTRPIIDLTEDSATMDHLLRYCYPVTDPIITDLDILDRILTAADKYDIKFVTTLATQVLHKFVDTKPLEVYTIACLHGSEDIAKKAAEMWKRTKNSWSEEITDFDSTPAGASYIPLMAKRLTTGPYYRLLQYLRGHQVTMFSSCDTLFDVRMQEGFWFQYPDVTSQYPFNCPNADIIFRSTEGYDLCVHKLVIDLQFKSSPPTASHGIWSGFTHSPQKSANGLPVVKTDLPRDVLVSLLEHCYPMQGDKNLINWSIKKLTSPPSLSVARAAARYGFHSVSQNFIARLRQLIPQDPLAVYCAAIDLERLADAREAAQELALVSPKSLYSADLESLPARSYYALLKYYHQCQLKIREAVSSGVCPVSITTLLQKPSYDDRTTVNLRLFSETLASRLYNSAAYEKNCLYRYDLDNILQSSALSETQIRSSLQVVRLNWSSIFLV